ncbi:MAG: ThuA domain-containing protein [Caulobacter sp.]|nr:ThuA domain-containing protein [Caulobacter sp.]
MPGLLRLIVAAGLLALVAVSPAAARPLRVLYLDQSVGWRHAPVIRPADGALAPSETAVIAIGRGSGVYTAEVTQDAREITPQRLAGVDVLVFYTTGALPISAEAWAAVQRRVAAGKLGFVGLHSAADTGWAYEGPGDSYARFIGGQFAGHPWTQGTRVRIETLDPDFPAMAMWPASFDYTEEIYQYAGFEPSRVRVLQTLDFTGTALKRPYAVPVAWARQVGRGRLFFSNLGHTPATWDDPRFRQQLAEAVKWTGRRTRGSARPDVDRQAMWQLRALLAYEPAAGRDDAAILARLDGADLAWKMATAERIADLRRVYPATPDSDRAPFEAAYQAVLAEVLAKGGG